MRVRANEEKGEGGEVRAETMRESGESESQSKDKREKKNKKNIKCIIYSNRVYMHGYCSNCAKMHNFIPTNMGDFLLKLCKINHFFHFTRLYIN